MGKLRLFPAHGSPTDAGFLHTRGSRLGVCPWRGHVVKLGDISACYFKEMGCVQWGLLSTDPHPTPTMPSTALTRGVRPDAGRARPSSPAAITAGFSSPSPANHLVRSVLPATSGMHLLSQMPPPALDLASAASSASILARMPGKEQDG